MIDFEDVEKMLNIIPFGREDAWVIIVIRDDDWYPDNAWEEEGVLYVQANLCKEDIKSKEWLPVQVKDKVLSLLDDRQG